MACLLSLRLAYKPCKTASMVKEMIKQAVQPTSENIASEPEVLTFGCRLNIYESEVMRAHAKGAGLGSDAVIVNTCAVTKEAERQARQAIRKARRQNPEAKIIVTGCSSQIDPQSYADMREVDHVVGNDLKLKAESWQALDARVLVNDIMAVKETAGHLIEGVQDHARAFIQVQNGCDHRCTFCIIPFGRGPSRSVPIGTIAEQMQKLVASGYKEIVLSGVDITSYGPDLPGSPTLGQMVRRVLALVPELPRLRLSSLDPAEIDEDLWYLIGNEPRLMPHLHLSVQAGDDMILKRMKRRHLRKDVIETCARARDLRPDIVFGADIIAGFPTEDDAMFENTLKLVEECDLTYLHVFPYSEREGTPAARMPAVPVPVRKERAAALRKLGDRQVDKFLDIHVKHTHQVIVEKNNFGRTEHFAQVRFEDTHTAGSLIAFKANGKDGHVLTGTVQ